MHNDIWHWGCVIFEIRAMSSIEKLHEKEALMKNIAVLCLGALLAIVGGCSRPPTESESRYEAWLRAIPNPGDSVIIESKTLNVGTGTPAAVVKVFITNKDTLAAYVFALVEKSVSGGAYMTLSHPRDFHGVVTPLTGTLQFPIVLVFSGIRYNSTSPDTFAIAGFWDPRDIAATAEPPNWTRKAFLEIKFDTVSAGPAGGMVEFDEAWIGIGTDTNVFTEYFDLTLAEIKPNFLKGTLNITTPGSSSAFLNNQ